MKPKIICIVGASGSGKTLASMILKEKFRWQAIVSYTTRPMRKGEINGVDHWFVAPDRKPSEERMCAYTQFGGYEYWTIWDQFNTRIPNIYVIDEKGLVDLQSKNSPFPFTLVTVKIKRENIEGIEEKRKERDKERISIPDELYDYIIHNDGSLEQLTSQLDLMIQHINLETKDNGSTKK